ncbi:phage protein NinX family protein [Xenorhabdus hominickii]|uniref:DUF2591 domain-containing protein n=1 Tax=Xenorhabdus hominickii TaxID=351679 RepID=A0A2G0Q5U1_XENHO|nr:phage protein NinX family protein [Xenorhabdus hominickii]AOM39651.1 hypothetical protein A9255_03015 [Xenorhabdus hominickii]PHM54561.1 hypothetical protein Xhom_02504 [Xenorhabdus hominickii]
MKMKIKTSELTGRALDYAVAMAQGWEKMAGYNGYSTPNGIVIAPEYIPSWDWAQCGQLIEEYWIEFKWVTDATIEAHSYLLDGAVAYGHSHLEAACRLVVLGKIGDEVEIPDELMEGV